MTVVRWMPDRLARSAVVVPVTRLWFCRNAALEFDSRVPRRRNRYPWRWVPISLLVWR